MSRCFEKRRRVIYIIYDITSVALKPSLTGPVIIPGGIGFVLSADASRLGDNQTQIFSVANTFDRGTSYLVIVQKEALRLFECRLPSFHFLSLLLFLNITIMPFCSLLLSDITYFY